MRALLGVCLFAFFTATSFAVDPEWGEAVNGLSVSLSIVPAETGKHPAEAAVQFSIRNSGRGDASVPIGLLMNARKVPGSFSLVSRDSDGVLRAVVYTGINGFEGTIHAWTGKLHPMETFTFREPVISYGRLATVLLEHGELWAEFRPQRGPDPTRDDCPGFCWAGTAFSNILKMPQ